MAKDEKKIEAIRHSLAHVMMQALEKMFNAIPAVGPSIENGFYHDFDSEHQVSLDDLPKIEEEMRKIIKEDLEIKRSEMPVVKGIEFLEKKKYKYTAELAKDLKEQGESLISFYEQGDFINMCKGPHVASTGKIRPDAFKLIRVAGAYWKGDEKNKMIQRVYGVAFESRKELAVHLKMMEEAEKRDHRKLGKELDLFVFSDIVGKGLPLLTPKGSVIRKELEKFVLEEETKRGYDHVVTPPLAKVDLYKKSGHYPYYKETMYPIMKVDEEELILRPMTCPHHFELFNSKPRSYREMPVRLAEISPQFRYEKSGELSGLTRVRMFCLADAHIVCAKDQAEDEIKNVLELIDYANKIFGLQKIKDYRYRLSLGDRKDEKKYYKDDAAWDKAEGVLRETLKKIGAPFYEAEGEAAFYGPKIDVQMKKVNGQEETAFTVQYDFVMPKRFDMKYIDKDGKEKEPVVIHRSSIGCFERTMAFLIEHYAGAFPVWLAPVQVKILSVGEKHANFSLNLANELIQIGIRAEAEVGDETVGNKIRKASGEKAPYIVVIGDKEMDGGQLAVRLRGQKDLKQMSKEDLIGEVKDKIEKRASD